MNFDLDVSDLRAIGFSPRRVLAVGATALTRTALAVAEAERAEMRDVFDRPKPYTLGALYTTPATAQTLEARVGLKDQASEGRPPLSWLRWQINGGLRRLTAWEKRLVVAGAMDGGDRAVPGKFAQLDAYGNISRGQLAQIFSQLRIETGRLGSTRTMPRLSFSDTAQERRRKQGAIRRAYRKAGGEFVAFPYGRGKLLPGLYLIRATAFGRTDPKPVLIFVNRAQYEPLFDFHYVGQLTVGRVLPQELNRAALASALVLKGRP